VLSICEHGNRRCPVATPLGSAKIHSRPRPWGPAATCPAIALPMGAGGRTRGCGAGVISPRMAF
jgi:hypothetical protein